MADESFSDLLQPGESVVARLSGEGRRAEGVAGGMERTWWQVALTQQRLLVVRMRAVGGDRWEVASRVVGPRGALRIAHFPRTREDTARLTIDGCGERIVFVDVDRPPVLPQVRPFLAAWGGPVAGGETLAVEEVDAYHGDAPEQKTLLYVAAAVFGLFFVCCGCLGLLGVLQQLYFRLV